ncbi:MAG: BlaI/MecI/CopY family transcriptional regulator [Fimbriimonadaceae bacterium]
MKILSKREQEIMELIYRMGRGSVTDVLEGLASPPSYSSVRALLKILEDKGQLGHEEVEGKYVYYPLQNKKLAGRGMLSRVVEAFFGGSHGAAALSLLGDERLKLSEAEIAELEVLISRAKEGSK